MPTYEADLHLWLIFLIMKSIIFSFVLNHCVQTDPAKNVWTCAYLILERNRTVRRQEEGKNSVYLFVFCMNLGEINALYINHFLLSDETFWLCHRILIEK
jgi:hypothetical protein